MGKIEKMGLIIAITPLATYFMLSQTAIARTFEVRELLLPLIVFMAGLLLFYFGDEIDARRK